jgi:hypothetical protein
MVVSKTLDRDRNLVPNDGLLQLNQNADGAIRLIIRGIRRTAVLHDPNESSSSPGWYPADPQC